MLTKKLHISFYAMQHDCEITFKSNQQLWYQPKMTFENNNQCSTLWWPILQFITPQLDFKTNIGNFVDALMKLIKVILSFVLFIFG